ncbi:enoyl-CoA hydratase [Virgibacillus salexigens]|uniref:2,3-dehydroadipyl-CoA hydratase n=1 Tax=Virgibacillus massiliensis TaxID=1462526 RepID=A0A024QET4_9BACI|nr:enoyl-CoA hydratase [Virgibacillus massiliensis]CDQ40730.1 2,3-dehydroadipyl-CoA hydratase [Virgibacillus massiliensis]
MGHTLIYESKDRVSYIHFNRADRYNAMNKEMLEELLQTIEKVEQSEDAIVILSGEGNAFSAGGDISMMKDSATKENFNEIMDIIGKVALKLYTLNKIVISAIHGSAAGLGLSIALTADFLIAQEDAKLGMLFIGIGLAPDGGGHFLLKERLGTQQAKQFIWGRKQVDGVKAKKMGLVDIVTEERVLTHAIKLANQLLSTPLAAMLATKSIYHSRQKDELKYYIEEEKQAQWSLKNTEDHQEGVQAFLDKREPVFQGK